MIDIKEVKRVIAEIVATQGSRRGFSAKQIAAKLVAEKNIPVSKIDEVEKKVAEILRTAEKFYRIVRFENGKYYVTEKFFDTDSFGGVKTILDYLQVKVKTKDEVLEEILNKEEENLNLPQFIALLIKLNERISIDDIIERIVKENPNPKELFADMLNFFADLVNSLREAYSKETALDRKDRLRRGVMRIFEIVSHIYGRILGIPIILSSRQHVTAPIVIDNQRLVISVNYDALKRFLERRILDDEFFVIEKFKDSSGKLIGIDSSISEIDLRKDALIKYRQIPKLRVITVVLASRSKSDVKTDLEFKPSPAEIGEYNIRKLEEERIVIPPSALLDFDPYYIPRVEEAIMQHREYKEVINILHNKHGIHVIYKDGALWPFERKFDDFIAIHRDYTVATLKMFYSLLNYFSPSPPYIIGIVKRGHLGFLWYIVLYYILKKTSETNKLSPESILKFISFIQRQESADGYLALLMLLAYKRIRGVPSGFTVRLFALIRKFYTADETLIRGFLRYCELKGKTPIEIENDIDAWRAIIWSLLMQRDPHSYGDAFLDYLRSRDPAILPQIDKEKLTEILDELVNSRTGSDFDIFVSLYEKLTEKSLEPAEYLSSTSRDVYHVLPTVASSADVVMTYYLPPIYVEFQKFEEIVRDGVQISLPRTEILWNSIKMHYNDRKEILRIINAIILDPFKDYYVLYDENVDRYLVVPVPVKDAHRAAKELLKKVSSDYENVLLKLLMTYLKTGM